MNNKPSPLHLALILGAMTAIMPLAVDMYLPSLPTLAESLDVDPSRVQLTLSAFFIGVASGQLLHGPLSDRYGRRPLMLAGLLLYALASAGCAVAESIEMLTALRFVQALGACGVIYLAKLNPDGTTSKITVPDAEGSVGVAGVGADGNHLNLQARVSCGPGQSLLDYDPATNTSTVLVGPPINGGGVANVVAYPGQE